MDPQAPEAAEFREGQRNQWNTAATGWEDGRTFIDSGAARISERIVELAGVQPGSRVLDVACGRGEPSLTAARAAAPDGSVTATDISAEMLAFGRDRAAAQGIENIEFVESGANALDFPAGTFDAAVSRWGIRLSARSRPPTCPRRGRAPCRRGRSRSRPWCRSWRSARSPRRRRPRPGSPAGRPAAGRTRRRNSR